MRINNIVYVKRQSNKKRKLLIFIPALIFLIILAIAAISVFNGLSLIHPRRVPVTSVPPSNLGRYNDVTFKDISGDYNLKGWFFKSSQNKGNIIIVHGYNQNRLQFGEGTFSLIKALIDGGYNILSFDLRNAGESDGRFTSLGYYEKFDIISAADWVRQTSPGKTTVLAFSTGASAALLAASESGSIDAVIADTPFSDLRSFLNRHLSQWTSLPSFPFNSLIILTLEVLCRMDTAKVSPEIALAKLQPKPVMFIHSSRDSSIPLDDNESMYESYVQANERSSVWYTDSDGHARNYDADPAEYPSKILSFIGKAYAK